MADIIVALPLNNISEISKSISFAYSETQEKAGFSDTAVTDQDQLE
jgi:hypothetical protein